MGRMGLMPARWTRGKYIMCDRLDESVQEHGKDGADACKVDTG